QAVHPVDHPFETSMVDTLAHAPDQGSATGILPDELPVPRSSQLRLRAGRRRVHAGGASLLECRTRGYGATLCWSWHGGCARSGLPGSYEWVSTASMAPERRLSATSLPQPCVTSGDPSSVPAWTHSTTPARSVIAAGGTRRTASSSIRTTTDYCGGF